MNYKNIIFKNFQFNKKSPRVQKLLRNILKENSQILLSLSKNYLDNFSKRYLRKYKKYNKLRIIGMGGSSLGAQAIYSFLKHKIKKRISFLNNLDVDEKQSDEKHLNLIISKSGNTLETIVNSNFFINKNDNNIFITETKKNYLYTLAQKLKPLPQRI